jgi:hypothetical protein
MKYLLTYDLRRTDERLIVKAEQLLNNALQEVEFEFDNDAIDRLRQRIHAAILGENVERYGHAELRTTISNMIERRGWTNHEIHLATSFLFETPDDVSIQNLSMILEEEEILNERIMSTDTYMLIKITEDNHYLLNN